MPTLVHKTPLPKAARLWADVGPGDFIDGYAVASPLGPRAAAAIGLSLPGWAKTLLGLRNALVRPLGLKADSSDTGQGAIFPVQFEDTQELILGTDDRHLNFRICLRQEDGLVHMGTWVHCHNPMGRAYLALVMPFHVLIVRNAMRRIARATP